MNPLPSPGNSSRKPRLRPPGPRLRLNLTLVGDYVRIWHEERNRGGSDSQILMRTMDAALTRSLAQARHDIYNELNAIMQLTTELRVILQNPDIRQRLVTADASASRIRSIVSQMNGH